MSESKSKIANQDYLLSDQYKTAANLRARMALHERFSTSKEDFARWVFDYIEAPDGARVLELGTGPANFWVKNRERIPRGWHVTLTDLSPGMLEEAKQATENIAASFEYQVVDAQDIPFEDDSFDMVIANHMLYHVPDLDKAVAEMRRVLKPGGKLYAATNGEEHMMELQAFIVEQVEANLSEASVIPMVAEKFTLANGRRLLSQSFGDVKLHTVKNNALKITEAKPFMAYILSMNSFQDAAGEVSENLVRQFINKASAEVEKRLESGPIHVTKSTGLFIAS